MKEIAYTMALGSIGIVGVQNQDQIKKVLPNPAKPLEYKETFAKRLLPKIKNLEYKTNKDEQSWSELDWLAKTIFSERHLTNPEVIPELLAIGSVILNRANDKGWSIKQTVTEKKAFSGVRKKGYFGWEQAPTETHYKVALKLLSEGVPEEYSEYRFFCNLPVVAKISPKNFRWFNKALEPIRTFPEPAPKSGQHTFFKAKT